MYVCMCLFELKLISLMGLIPCRLLKDTAAVPVPLHVVSCMVGPNYYVCAHSASFLGKDGVHSVWESREPGNKF